MIDLLERPTLKTAAIRASPNISMARKVRALAAAIENGDHGSVTSIGMIIETGKIEVLCLAADGCATPIEHEGALLKLAKQMETAGR